MELVVMDTVNVLLKRKSDGHLVAKTKTQMGSISQTVGEERLKGAIGNKTIAVLSTDKEIEVTYRNALWDLEYLAMTQGVAVETGAVKFTKTEEVEVEEGGVVTLPKISSTQKITGAIFQDKDGTQEENITIADAATSFTVPEGSIAEAGDKVTVFYEVTDSAASVVEFDSQRFSENYELLYSTICYNPDTMEVVKDLYIQFDNVKPSGAFDMSFEAGTAITPELSFMVLSNGNSSSMGRIFTVDRK